VGTSQTVILQRQEFLKGDGIAVQGVRKEGVYEVMHLEQIKKCRKIVKQKAEIRCFEEIQSAAV